MDNKKFKFWNNIVSLGILAISAFTYIATIEPTASFWDCGEFIASSYKLEVGHPPGNPVFQLIARFFTMFGGADGAAVAVNVMSALCSALTIYFLYLTIVFFAKRLVRPGEDGTYTTGRAVAIFGSAAVGALAYCFSDTFWFSAVEGEVYAMSSLFTALVLWAMTKWYEQAFTPYANRWIVLIAFLMGLSIGVHLLNLLTIPALVFLFYYRRRETGHYTFWQYLGILVFSAVIIAVILFGIVPWLPKLAAYMDIFFVNKLHLPVNSGAAFFVLALLALCFVGLFYTYGKHLANTVLLCFTTIVVGFSIFSIVIIRSSVMPPSNENQPDNAFSLLRYLSRDQYGKTPLIYGQYFGSGYADLKTPKYWVYMNGRYEYVDGPIEPVYAAGSQMFFPRMWSNADDKYIKFYKSYMDGKGVSVPGSREKKPTFFANLRFFFDYQMNWMYWRYFMWNFVGRQNEIHSPTPGEAMYGNWESGIKFIDELHHGNHDEAPEALSANKGKNHYYFLPLLLGLLGLFYQFDKDKRGCWLVFLLFIMTGIAIVVYLNQPPYQVRERDYAYAGSFYAFSIWIGFAALALYEIGEKALGWAKDNKKAVVGAAAISAVCLCVPALMAQQNWDDHDRSHRYTSVEMARNYLNSVGPDGILITHGDNDTFPLWYVQEVENVRPDVRICNTSLLGTDWYIGQMKYASNASAPLPLQIGANQYLYGTNDFVRVVDSRDQVIPISDVMKIFRHPDAKITLEDGSKIDYIMSRKISVPVNKENALKCGIVPESMADLIQDEIILEIPKDHNLLSKCELFMLDLLSDYQWDRPIHLLSQGGDIKVGLRNYLMYDGFSTKLVPFRNRITSTDLGKVDLDGLYAKMMDTFKWDALSRKDYFVDYQNLYTFLGVLPQREIFCNVAEAMYKEGRIEETVALLDKCQECVPQDRYPLESSVLGFYHNDIIVLKMVELYYKTDCPEKALVLGQAMGDALLQSIRYYATMEYCESELEFCCNYYYYLEDLLKHYGHKEESEALATRLDLFFSEVAGYYPADTEPQDEE